MKVQNETLYGDTAIVIGYCGAYPHVGNGTVALLPYCHLSGIDPESGDNDGRGNLQIYGGKSQRRAADFFPWVTRLVRTWGCPKNSTARSISPWATKVRM